MNKKTKSEFMIENLIDEKYYSRESNILNNDDDLYKFLTNIYGYPADKPMFKYDGNHEFNPYSTCCILIEIGINGNYHLSAYYIPESYIQENFELEFTNCMDIYTEYSMNLVFDYSLEYILEQSRIIPKDNSLKNDGYHTYGADMIIFNNRKYKRIDTSFLKHYDLYLENDDYLCEFIIPLYKQSYIDFKDFKKEIIDPFEYAFKVMRFTGNDIKPLTEKMKFEIED
jgi:hypothetical protein